MGKNIVGALQTLGRGSEELFRGDRLPALNLSPPTVQAPEVPEAH
jgi:hypothetical protein